MANASSIRRIKARTTASAQDRRFLPALEDIPIPPDVTVGPTWSETVCELADWIGAYDALRLCEVMGGTQIYISLREDHHQFGGVLSADKVTIMARVFGGTRYPVPTASKEIRFVRRAALIASVRAGVLTGAVAAQIAGTSRTHMASLVNRTDQGVGLKPIVLPEPKVLQTLKEAANSVVAQLGAAGVDSAIIAKAWAAIMIVWGEPEASNPILARAPAAPPIGDADGV